MWVRCTAAREGAVSTMTANQSPVEPRPDVPDPTVDRTLPEDDVLRRRAMERLKKKADFRMHLLIYVLVNSALVVIWVLTGSSFFWPAIVMVGWGIGIVANAADVYLMTTPTEEQVTEEMERLRHR